MKIIKKNVYYCDFCKKHSLKNVIEHEKHCTMNVNRACRLCDRKENLQELVNKYLSITNTEFKKVEDIMDDVDGCPICCLTIIRLAKLNKSPNTIDFNFEEEVEKYWDEKNEVSLREEFPQIYNALV